MELKSELFLAVLVLCTVITATGRITESCFQRRLKRATSWRCCGAGDIYNPRTQICCGSSVYDHYSGSRCCGVTPFNPSTHICCAGNVRVLTPGNTRCCGQRDYNPSKETCCGGRVVTSIGRCCGSKPFIPDTHICCFGTPSPRPLQATSVRCCGRNAYDLDRKSCCRGSIRPLGYPCGCQGKKGDLDKLCPL